VDLDPAVLSGRQAAEGLAQRGVLAKETHDITIRYAPPLVITFGRINPSVQLSGFDMFQMRAQRHPSQCR
jgi:ornithine--oxo-acid transaminase